MLLVKFVPWLSVVYAVGCWRSSTASAIGSMSMAVPEAIALLLTTRRPQAVPDGGAVRSGVAWRPADETLSRSNSSWSPGLSTMISGTDSFSSIVVMALRMVTARASEPPGASVRIPERSSRPDRFGLLPSPLMTWPSARRFSV